MNFALSELLLVRLILLVYFISDVTSIQLAKYSNSNELAVVSEPTNTSFLLPISAEITTKNAKSKKIHKPVRKRRRRLRKKNKKFNVDQNTTFSSLDFSTVSSTISPPQENVISKKHKRRRKLKKLKKGGRPRKKNITTPIFRKYKPVSKNLVLPIFPTQTILPINLTTVSQRKTKKTRCTKRNGGCAHICHSKGTQKCHCFKGFTLVNDRHKCVDINECLTNNGGCDMNCSNTIGSYRCQCDHGLRLGADSKTCLDVNECLLRNGHGPCQDSCENNHGGYKCNCNNLKGTKLGNDLHSCVDVDECAKDNGGCSHICINTFGRLFCSCPEGMELSADFKTCQDINECENESAKKTCPNGCINTEGSYRCVSIFDIQNDESHKEVVCKPLFPPKNGYFKCSRKHALKTYTKSGRKRTKNSLGTKCILICPEGFKRKGFRISCGYGGQWIGTTEAKCISVSQSDGRIEK